jgi:hypothetical protein
MPIPFTTPQPSFNNFVFREKTNRRYCIIAAAAIAAQIIVFKIFYPFASFFYTDSFGYLYAAASNQDVNVWPVGYSKFLRLFNTFLHDDGSLVIFQYLFLQAAGIYTWFSLRYFFRPSKAVTITLFVFTVFQPVWLYIANSVSSDALFIGLSLIWISRLMWMMAYPSRRSIVTHALLLAALFTIRYTAIYYPLAAALAIGLSRYSIKEKIGAILLPVALIAVIIVHTGEVTRQMTGISQFAPFSGWQLANNALYLYGHVNRQPAASPDMNPVPSRFARLDSMTRRFFKTDTITRHGRTKIMTYTGPTVFEVPYPGIYYLWSPNSPLIQYMGQHRDKDTAAYFRNWASVAPLYADYGAWLIKTHPAAFLQYYCWPNLQRYALPPLEFMGRYNSGEDTVASVARVWFRYKDDRVRAVAPSFQHELLAFYPLLNLLVNLFFLGMLGLFLTTRGAAKADPFFSRYVYVMAGLWLFHFLFTVLASPVVLRYQLFIMIAGFSFSLLLAEFLVKWEAKTGNKTKTYEILQPGDGGLRLCPDPSLGLHGNG